MESGGDRRRRSRTPPRYESRFRPPVRPSPSGTQPAPGSHLIIVPTHLPPEQKQLADIVAQFVSQGGWQLEADIAGLQEHNPLFDFLRPPWNSTVSVYYRWRLYSLLQGDSLTHWRMDPYRIESYSDRWWVPPLMPGHRRTFNPGVPAHLLQDDEPMMNPLSSSNDGPGASSIELMLQIREHGLSSNPLPSEQRAAWFALLRDLKTPDREKIGAAMVFAIDRSVYAYDLLESLVDSIDIPGMAVLFLAEGPKQVEYQSVINGASSQRDEAAVAKARQSLAESALLVTQATERALARLFLLHDILCNVFALCKEPTANPRHLTRAADLILPRLFEELMSAVIVTSTTVQQQEDASAAPASLTTATAATKEEVPATVITVHPGTAIGELVGWFRELWAMWSLKGCISHKLIALFNAQYGFLLGTAAAVPEG